MVAGFGHRLAEAKSERRLKIHSFHRYFGKLIPAIPRAAIMTLTAAGARVLDPFCGSGTTLVEAAVLGRPAVGLDVNPLAALIARVKSRSVEPGRLEAAFEALAGDILADRAPVRPEEVPFCVNMEHWFRPGVVADLARIRRRLLAVEDERQREFFLACFSATLRDVSNADPRHIFPGYSKRLRRLDALGLRRIDAVAAFLAGVRRRLAAHRQYCAACPPGAPEPEVYCADAREFCDIGRFDLVVTNPPYISSIRFLETLKLEMYWLGFVDSPQALAQLDRGVLGTERLSATECRELAATGCPEADAVIGALAEQGQRRMAKVVERYFRDTDALWANLARWVVPGGHAVIKISDSHVRGFTVPTHRLVGEIAERHGFELLEALPDAIKSRSLPTKRNVYSGLIPHDWILLLRRSG